MADEVVVVAIAVAAEGQHDAVRDALTTAVAQVHDEPGCETYALHERADGAFVMIERWLSADALAVHSAGSAVARMGTAVEGRLVRPIEVTTMQARPAGDPVKGVL